MMKHRGGTKDRMPGKWQFFEQVENPGLLQRRIGRGFQEDCFEMPELLRDAEHRVSAQVRAIVENGKAISTEGKVAEDVNVHVIEAGHGWL